MRAIKRTTDGVDEIFLAEVDVEAFLQVAQTATEQSSNIVKEYIELTTELATAWEAYKKDRDNFQLLFALSARVQNLANLTIAIRDRYESQ